jgi:hypothetical protein
MNARSASLNCREGVRTARANCSEVGAVAVVIEAIL